MNKLRHIKEFLPTLEQLCQPLNVDKTTEEIVEEHGEFILKIETLNEKIEEIESDLGDYKEELEVKKEGIRDLIEYVEGLTRKGLIMSEYEKLSKLELYNLFLKELRAVEVMK